MARIVLLAILALIGAAFAGLISAADGLDGFRLGPVLSIVRFTLLQAILSTLLALALGAMLALALARRRFPGRQALVVALGAVSALPAIIVVFALTSIWGRGGVINEALAFIDLPRLSIYGLPGILLAHVFFNAPFAARVYLGAIERTPGEHWRLAASLDMPPSAIFRLIDGPRLLRETPQLAILIFLVCATSFAIPLSLGGGPGAATLEVAIFEAVRFDADFGQAALLAGLQIAVLALLAVLVSPLLARPVDEAVVGRLMERPDRVSGPLAALDVVMIGLGLLLVLPPLAAIAWSSRALPGVFNATVLNSVVTSLSIAVPSAALCVVCAYALARGRASGASRGGLIGQAPFLALAVPPVALAAGLYILARRWIDPASIAVPALIVLNALMALPFAYRLMEPPLLVAEARYGRLAASLGLVGLSRLRFVDGPLVRPATVTGLALAAALSLGDLGVVSLFGSESLRTLPALLYERLGAYRMADAEAIAAILTGLVLALVAAARLAGGVRADGS